MADVYAPSADVEFGDVAETREDHKLASNALGLPQVLFCIVTGAAPIAAMLFNVPVSISGGGWASPSAFLIATVVLTIFSVGYIEMSRRVTAAGGFYSFITHGFGPVVGMGTATLISLCYVVFCAAVIGVTAYFASTSFDAWFGVNVPAWLIMAAIVAITGSGQSGSNSVESAFSRPATLRAYSITMHCRPRHSPSVGMPCVRV